VLDRYDLRVVLALLGLGLVPNTLGHTLYNAAVRRLNAAVANVIFTQEMTGAIILAWLILGEVPSVNALVGASIMLVGILLVLLR
jgi:drug/metabolite transporter (DMT)-like permease